MDTSKDMLESALSQRLQDRNLNKELQKTDSISDETANDKYAFVGMPTDSSATKSGTSRTVADSFAPPVFGGTNADADTWLAHFQRYAEYRQLSDEDIIAIFPLFLRETAVDWYETLGRDAKSNLQTLVDNFKAYFGKSLHCASCKNGVNCQISVWPCVKDHAALCACGKSRQPGTLP